MSTPKPTASQLVYWNEISDTKSAASDTNTYSIYCPNKKCKCLILRYSKARFSSRAIPCQVPPLPSTLELPSPSVGHQLGDEVPVFGVNDMMTFENIGFSKTVNSSIKYLLCADCDVGPLGFQELGSGIYSGCYIHADRVRFFVSPSAVTAET